MNEPQEGLGYYDGSLPLQAASEGGAEAVRESDQPAGDEWRRFVGGNPYEALE